MKTFVTSLAFVTIAAALAACGKAEPSVHNLSPDELRRAEINAGAYFNQDFPSGTNAAGELTKKKGAFISCRPQDSNDNGLVTCTGMRPTMEGKFSTVTVYCGYASGKDAILSCNDKDQK